MDLNMNKKPLQGKDNNESDFQFEDLFQMHEIQEMQNSFSAATGVASIITYPDGKPITNENLKNIDPKTIESMEVLKNQNAIELYGEKAKDGVILVKSKKEYAKKY